MRLALLLLPFLAGPVWADAPLILRGRPADGERPARASPAPAAVPRGVVGGGRLWLVDPASERLTGCALERTTQLGVRRIRCTTRDLP